MSAGRPFATSRLVRYLSKRILELRPKTQAQIATEAGFVKTLKRVLDSMDRTAAVILTTTTGRAWASRYFKAQWEKASRAAGIEDLHFHDLRGTAVTLLAEAGCSVPEIAAITGHTMKSVHGILERYMARTKALAGAAIEKFENASSTTFANQLQTSAKSEPGKPAKFLK